MAVGSFRRRRRRRYCHIFEPGRNRAAVIRKRTVCVCVYVYLLRIRPPKVRINKTDQLIGEFRWPDRLKNGRARDLNCYGVPFVRQFDRRARFVVYTEEQQA